MALLRGEGVTVWQSHLMAPLRGEDVPKSLDGSVMCLSHWMAPLRGEDVPKSLDGSVKG